MPPAMLQQLISTRHADSHEMSWRVRKNIPSWTFFLLQSYHNSGMLDVLMITYFKLLSNLLHTLTIQLPAPSTTPGHLTFLENIFSKDRRTFPWIGSPSFDVMVNCLPLSRYVRRVNKLPFPPTLVGENFLKIACQGRITIDFRFKGRLMTN